MAKIIDLLKRKAMMEEAEAWALAYDGGLETYDDAIEVLDSLLSMKEGDVFLVYLLDGNLLCREMTGTKRFVIDPEELE
jgi:hypothetical protein